MSSLVENPTWIIVLGIVIEGLLAIPLVSTRKPAIALAMLGVLLVVLLGVWLEWLIVTEKERVEATLYGAAETVEANDLDRLLNEYIASHAVVTRQYARVLEEFDVSAAKISQLEIKVNDLTSPPSAEATFVASVHFEDPRGRIPYRQRAARCTVVLWQEGDRWLVVDPVQIEDVN